MKIENAIHDNRRLKSDEIFCEVSVSVQNLCCIKHHKNSWLSKTNCEFGSKLAGKTMKVVLNAVFQNFWTATNSKVIIFPISWLVEMKHRPGKKGQHQY